MTRCARSDALLLTPDQMSNVDALAAASGLPGIVLMENAASAVAAVLRSRHPSRRKVAILAGPGNNGGDGFALGRILQGDGRDVVVFTATPASKLEGDAAQAAAAYHGPIEPLSEFHPDKFDLIVDALFGAGLSRAIEGEIRSIIDGLNECDAPVVAIDLPSGISGLSGKVLGTATRADITVTFFRRKPGHLLEPGRSHCGEIIVADIGLAEEFLDEVAPSTFANEPTLWRSWVRAPGSQGHKYDRGHAVVFSGGVAETGAARLAAEGALRAGAGLVTLASPAASLIVNAAHLTAVMLRRVDGPEDLTVLLQDERLNTFMLGPGFGIGERARAYARAILERGRRLVLDADGLTSFKDDPHELFRLTATNAESGGRPDLVLTPHAGEFVRLFPDIAEDASLSKLDHAKAAAERAGAVVVLKGADTVIAGPDGLAAINASGTPWLATAGSGDVLAGIIAGRLAQGVPAFEATASAVWMHGRAAELFGPGLISEDLPRKLPQVLAELSS